VTAFAWRLRCFAFPPCGAHTAEPAMGSPILRAARVKPLDVADVVVAHDVDLPQTSCLREDGVCGAARSSPGTTRR
jgi:hypothetical protein